MGSDNVIPFPLSQGASSGADVHDMRQWLASIGGFGDELFAREVPQLLRKRSKKAAYVVRIDLDNARPPIWRRLRLASDLTLGQMHDLVQIAMGWTDSHLHHFVMGPDDRDLRRQYFLAPYDIEEGEQGIDEDDVRLDQVLAKPGQRLFYEYDFGDGWWHTIKLEKVEPWVDGAPDAVCVTGRRACPPEDIGGIYGFEEALTLLAGQTDGVDPEWVKQITDWLGDFDPTHFSVDEVNEALTVAPLPE